MQSRVYASVFGCYISLFNKVLKKTSNFLEKHKNNKDYYKKDLNRNKQIFISLLHSKGREYIEHFSDIKMNYKIFVFGILTALLVALSYIYSSISENIHINVIYLITSITFFSIIGIALIRFLDINISHEQIRLLYSLIMRVEKDYPNLSNPYVEMHPILYQDKSDPALYDWLYYGVFNFSMLVFGFTMIILSIQPHHLSKNIAFCILALSACLIFEITSFVLAKKNKRKKL